ncbi:MAG TPA: DEAD/DEAH box helicase family protein [Prolixibacteraceae bacterium]|nr:DEAD/DEAH box helicase family protein [Prolixibacteraceae bacterium]
MSNFRFLKNSFPALYAEAADAEKHTFTAPKYAALLSRSALEKAVYWIYENDPELSLPYNPNLSSLIHDQAFRSLISQQMFQEINLVRLTGNNAAHGKKVTQNESLVALKGLFRFLSFVSKYYSEENPQIPTFDERLIPDGKENDKTLQELKSIAEKLSEQTDKLNQERNRTQELARENELLKLQIEKQERIILERKEERKTLSKENKYIPELIPESVTRKLYIDLLLKEAGWDTLRQGRELEYEVCGMPKSTNPTGIGYVDYVLWGDDGLPLAVVEAKKTSVDSHKGQHQAELYANCLEKMTGQRPVIFYTNGFESHIWDDIFYPPRPVSGFYTKDELQLLIDRRKSRTDLRKFKVDTEIVGRPYQLEAIQRVAETLVTDLHLKLKGKNRKALLVMATGSGKTRVSAAIVDMLTKCNWVKRVLFLADRNALVTQAKNAFKEHLPNLSAIDLTKEKEDNGTRLVFSTYPSIMNKIDSLKVENGRFYGPGHFDLIIIDEAHRSVYQKYKAIFDYFDSLLIGLTATPKTQVDHNTYSLFDIEDHNPTFAYELIQAVPEYLKPPKAITVPMKFPREGIKYADLSEAEKAEYELKFGDPSSGEMPDEIDSDALNSWLFNKDTVDKVLDHLMTNGLKTQGGDKLGKTIIFARNHKHALFIEERFNKNYPEYSGKFLRVIDNYETKAQNLLETFCLHKEEENPQIAVSVDMMDTGVDAPRVVNLVFFKPVKSATKFWQMIGRGTRLCPDLFGPGLDKEYFLIFDFCENFEFFSEFPDGITPSVPRSLSQQVFETRLEIAQLIRSDEESTQEDQSIASLYIDELHGLISTLNQERFVVRKELRLVNEYTDRNRWENISKGDFVDICNHLSNLPAIADNDDELARRFDLLVLNLQLAILLKSTKQRNFVERISRTGRALVKKKNIPAVNEKIEMIKAVQTEEFWQEVSLKRLEQVRTDLRELIKFIDAEPKKIVYTNFEDVIDDQGTKEVQILPTYTSLQSYRERVESYIRKNQDFLVIHKIQNNIQITNGELNLLEEMLFSDSLGTKADFKKEYGDMPLGKFIRSILGLDKKAANELFAEFIQSGNLSGNQITFINNIISFLTKNGTIDKSMFFEPPFTHIHDQGITGIFDDVQVGKIIRIIDQVNSNAVKSIG